MSKINLNLYRIFCEVARSTSYAEASEKLNLSTSNISTQITNLENLLETQLFYRQKTGVKLTTAGEELYTLADQAMSAIDLGEKLMLQKNDISGGEIKIGCQSHLAIFYLMEKIQKVKQDYPGVKIKLVSGTNIKEMFQLLQNRKVDFIIIDVLPEETNNVEIKKLKTISNAFISKEPIEIKEIKEIEKFNYILNFANTYTTKKLIEVLKQNNISIKANMECDITELRIDAVKRNIGIGYIMKEAVKEELEKGELYEVKMPFELPKLEINLVNMKNQLTQVDKQFIKKYLKE